MTNSTGVSEGRRSYGGSLRPSTPPRARHRLGVLVDWLKDGYQTALIQAVDQVARARDVDLLSFAVGILGAQRDAGLQRNRLLDLVSPELVDGLVVFSGCLANEIGPDALARYCHRFRPRPLVSVALELPGMDSVVVDNDHGIRANITHLVEVHGLRDLAFIRGPAANAEAERRYAVFCEVMRDHGLPAHRVHLGDFQPSSGVTAVAAFLANGQRPPEGIIGASDAMALGALEALRARGLSVPEDMALVGFDDIEESRYATPALTTVRQPLGIVGQTAAELAIRHMREQPPGRAATLPDDAPMRLVLPTQLVIRRSCGCHHDPHVPTIRREVHTREQALEARVAEIVSALPRIAPAPALPAPRILPTPTGPAKVDSPLPSEEDLVQAFVHDTAHQDADAFLQTLTRMAADDPAAYQPLITALRRSTVPWLAGVGVDAWTRSENLLHDARVHLAEQAERQQATRRLMEGRWTRHIGETSEALHGSFELGTLMSILGARIPQLGIPTAYLVLHVPGDPLRGRLMLAVDGRPRSVTPTGRPRFSVSPPNDGTSPALFAVRDLLPEGVWPERRGSWVVEPLFAGSESFGYLLLEIGPREGQVYEAIRDQISGALKAARLVEQVIDEAMRREQAERERLSQEMEIATRIQSSIVPRSPKVPGYDIAAFMRPTAEVGGDYYDVLALPSGGCVVGIGDVAGHGLRTGLVMLMLQSIVSTLVHADPEGDLARWLRTLNAVLYENVRDRLGQDEHTTLTLLRLRLDGEVRFAGAHEDLIVLRSLTRRCELISTPGTWVAARREIAHATPVNEFALDRGDILVLYTDGITEAFDTYGEPFGLERLTQLVETTAAEHGHSAEAMCNAMAAAITRFAPRPEDDMTLVIVRRT